MKALAGLQRIQASRASVFSANDLRLLFRMTDAGSLHTTLHRLVARGVLRRLRKGVFLCPGKPLDPFALANLLRRPSYISLESALNLHGLLVQTPRVVTSVTTGRPGHLRAGGHEFAYRHLTPRLWFGFERNGDFLMASPEKAFLDWLYLASRADRPGLLDDLAWRRLDRQRLERWAAAVPSPAFHRAYRQWLRKG